MSIAIGVIADDFTGATDIASMLTKGGMRVLMTLDVPEFGALDLEEADAIVVALKSRSNPPDEATTQSLDALTYLQRSGARQIIFKYCSTFDSTPEGNIGTTSDALMDAMNVDRIVHIPALPVNGRTIFKGHMFVHGDLLHESGMQNHPVNPMTDANLMRWLAQQTDRVVSLIDWQELQTRDLQLTERDGHIIGDTVSDVDLEIWAEQLKDEKLIAGGSGLATPLAKRHMSDKAGTSALEAWPRLTPGDRAVILAGSCSRATLAQLKDFDQKGGAIRRLDPLDLARTDESINEAIDWARQQESTPLIAASADPDAVAAAQQELGADKAGRIVEQAFAKIASTLMQDDTFTHLIVAGGETSGAVVQALDIAALRIGPTIDPGVPWTQAYDSQGQPRCQLALKSGNFGATDFFTKAMKQLA